MHVRVIPCYAVNNKNNFLSYDFTNTIYSFMYELSYCMAINDCAQIGLDKNRFVGSYNEIFSNPTQLYKISNF